MFSLIFILSFLTLVIYAFFRFKYLSELYRRSIKLQYKRQLILIGILTMFQGFYMYLEFQQDYVVREVEEYNLVKDDDTQHLFMNKVLYNFKVLYLV